MTLQLLEPFRFQLLHFVAADCTKSSLGSRGREVWVKRTVRFWKRWVAAPLQPQQQQPLHHSQVSQGCVFHFPPALHTTPAVPTQEKVKSGGEGSHLGDLLKVWPAPKAPRLWAGRMCAEQSSAWGLHLCLVTSAAGTKGTLSPEESLLQQLNARDVPGSCCQGNELLAPEHLE